MKSENKLSGKGQHGLEGASFMYNMRQRLLDMDQLHCNTCPFEQTIKLLSPVYVSELCEKSCLLLW